MPPASLIHWNAFPVYQNISLLRVSCFTGNFSFLWRWNWTQTWGDTANKISSFAQQFSLCHPILELPEHRRNYMRFIVVETHNVRYFISTHRLWWWTSHYGNPSSLLPSPSIIDCHYLFAAGGRHPMQRYSRRWPRSSGAAKGRK